VEVVATLSQGRTAAAQCGLFTYKSVSVMFEPPCTFCFPTSTIASGTHRDVTLYVHLPVLLLHLDVLLVNDVTLYQSISEHKFT